MSQKKAKPCIIFSDYPDADVIRVEQTYYMISTTMHFFPSGVILRSYNLVDWEIISYVSQNLQNTQAQKMQNGKTIYGSGMWAATLRYHKGTFFALFVCNDTGTTLLYRTNDILGNWQQSIVEGFYHDASLLFDEERIFLISGNTNIRLIELNDNLTAPKQNGIDKIIIKDDTPKEELILGYEGSHFYKIDNTYYVFLIHWKKNHMRSVACFTSNQIDGTYKGGDIFESDFLNWKNGVAQGGIVDDGKNNFYAILFQDHGALGRMPILVPVKFDGKTPIFGKNAKVQEDFFVTDFKPNHKYKALYCNDFLDNDGALNKCWQFNHIADKNFYKFVSKNCYQITTNTIAKNPLLAKNTLTQRAFSHNSFCTVCVDASNINDGDFAGLCALQGAYSFVAITKQNDNFFVVCAKRKSKVEAFKIGSIDNEKVEILQKIKLSKNCTKVTLKMQLDFCIKKDSATFFYKEENKNNFKQIANSLDLFFTLDQFVGVRYALFMYSTKKFGANSKFCNFTYNLV